MTKKDRIAIVLTVPIILVALIALISSSAEEAGIFLAPVVVYWGYRFIKNDISFMKK